MQCMHVCMYVTYVCMHLGMYVCHVCMHVCTHVVRMHVCMYVFMYVYVCMYEIAILILLSGALTRGSYINTTLCCFDPR